MKVILTTTDRPLVETVRATLEADGIAVFIEGDAVTALPFIPMRVLVADKDVALAQNVVTELANPTSGREGGRNRRWARLFLVAILIAVLVVCGNILIG